MGLTIKERVAEQAAGLVEEGMIVGLGSGTTATYFIHSLGKRCQNGLNIRAVSTSLKSAQLAAHYSIPLIDDQLFTQIDLCIDGADEVAPDLTLIKGGGGDLVREKIVAKASLEMIVIVDESKLVKTLGRFGVPLEVLPFGVAATLKKITLLGYEGTLRRDKNQKPFVTDNGNYIYDIDFNNKTCHPVEDDAALKSITGVVDTGFFFNIAKRALVGYSDGRVAFFPHNH
jgi:ribose 5-phosphate isomerase A